MKPKIKETIRLSVEVQIEYTDGLREEAVTYAKRQCIMHASSYPEGGVIVVKTSGSMKEIKAP